MGIATLQLPSAHTSAEALTRKLSTAAQKRGFACGVIDSKGRGVPASHENPKYQINSQKYFQRKDFCKEGEACVMRISAVRCARTPNLEIAFSSGNFLPAGGASPWRRQDGVCAADGRVALYPLLYQILYKKAMPL
ncbi:MAG TPA: hypothetical protein H9812_05825 [Candidatus Gallimonas intestinigallinarum]|uniref:Uncharacterized protein n=1 Tax=Candidatus Gallimonas intestinigallinarum TaxID=2838604 RepID=A0A9D2DXR7_9FIRM|nr:hypothetical protein [Candidatus Gallimonas intestinigallinarum]